MQVQLQAPDVVNAIHNKNKHPDRNQNKNQPR